MKPGDKVKVKSLEDIAAICTRRNTLGELQHESEVTFAATMERLCGQEVTIHSVKEGDWGTFYAIEGSSYAWYDWMFEEPQMAPPHMQYKVNPDGVAEGTFDKTVHCIPQDVFEYPEDKLYMSQLLSAEICKLTEKIKHHKSKLSMLEKKRNAYREMQSKL